MGTQPGVSFIAQSLAAVFILNGARGRKPGGGQRGAMGTAEAQTSALCHPFPSLHIPKAPFLLHISLAELLASLSLRYRWGWMVMGTRPRAPGADTAIFVCV